MEVNWTEIMLLFLGVGLLIMAGGLINQYNRINSLIEQTNSLSERLEVLEPKLDAIEVFTNNSDCYKTSPKVVLDKTIKFVGNKTFVVSLEANETIICAIQLQSSTINFTFGSLKDQFDSVAYESNLIPEYEIVLCQQNTITQISFEYTTLLEGEYGFSLTASNLVVADISLKLLP